MRRLAAQLPRPAVRGYRQPWHPAGACGGGHVRMAGRTDLWPAEPGNLTAVTGARGPRVLGALHRGAVTTDVIRMPQRPRRTTYGPVHQSRAVAARVQPARAGAGHRRRRCRCWNACVSCAFLRSNLDEFFEIRVAGLKQLEELDALQRARTALWWINTLAAIHDRAARLIADQYACLEHAAAARAAANVA